MFSTNVCENPHILKIILFGSNLIKIVYYLIPVILIVMLTMDFAKNVVFANDESIVRKNIQIAIKRIIYIIVLFLVPTIVSATLNLVENSNLLASNVITSYNKCIENTKKINFYEKTYEFKVKQEQRNLEKLKTEILKNKNQEEERKELFAEKLKYKTKNKLLKAPDSNTNTNSGGNQQNYVGIGQAYNDMTEEELIKIASLCQQEQGSAIGAAAEATLMANKYELSPKKSQFKNLYYYVRDNGEAGNGKSWWLYADTYMNKMNATPDILSAVKNVIVNGNRTMPPYINEHDCIYCGNNIWDVEYLIIDGKKIESESGRLDHNNYIQNKTQIYNAHESYYTFYIFPTESSDPFGYTPDAYSTINGNG